MRKYTPKRARLEAEYKKVLREIYEERGHWCAGCGTTSRRLTPSHRIPRSWSLKYLAEKENIDWMCDICHPLVELGRYDLLENGQDILDYMEIADPEYFRLKTSKITLRSQEDIF